MHGLALTLLLAAPMADAAGTPLLVEALGLYNNGQDTRADYEAAVARFDAAIAAGLPDAERARAHAWKGMTLMRAGDLRAVVDEKLPFYKRGEAEAKKGIAIDERCADCWYVASACLGRWGEQRGVMNSLFTAREVIGGFERALAIDPQHAEAMLAMGKVDEALPFFAGGSTDRAEQRFRGVLTQKPTFTRAMLDLAELLAREDRADEARDWAKRALAEKTPFIPGEFRKWDRARAQALLKRLDE